MVRKVWLAVVGVLAAWVALGVPAQAFTREAAPSDSGGSARFSDPDEQRLEKRFQPSPDGRGGTINFGGSNGGGLPGFSFSIRSNEREPRGAWPGDPLYRR